jgi:ribosomal-protein-alanine N-acetyltransferase
VRLYLRHPTAADEPELTALNRASADFHRPWVRPPTTSEEFAAYLARAAGDDFEGLLLCKKADDAIVGVVNFSQIFRGGFQNAYSGYYLGAAYAGQGYMTEGLGLALDHAFGPLGLHRIEANIQPANLASKAVVARLGFRLEGFSPRYLKVAGRWRDHERWAILSEEWWRP